MLARHKQLLSSYERVQDFLNSNPPPQPPPRYAERRAELDAKVARLRVLLKDQQAGQQTGRDDTRRQRAARRLLRVNHLAPISRIAKVALPAEQTIQQAFAMPVVNLSTQRLITWAAAMRDSAAKYEAVFEENGRPPDFLAQLDRAIDDVRETMLNRGRNVGRHVGAKAGLGPTLAAARRCVQMLDAMVLDAFAGNAELIARWRLAKRVQQVPGVGSAGIRATGGTADENLPVPAPVPAPRAA